MLLYLVGSNGNSSNRFAGFDSYGISDVKPNLEMDRSGQESPTSTTFPTYRPEPTSFHQRTNCNNLFGSTPVEALNLSAAAAVSASSDRSNDLRRSLRNVPYADPYAARHAANAQVRESFQLQMEICLLT